MSDEITVGPQPSSEDLARLSEQGFRSVVNLREAGEEGQPMSPAEEGEEAGKFNMAYTNLPVSSKSPMRDEQVDQFRETLEQLPKPAFVHCAKGKRAGALALMHQALENDWSGDEAIEQAAAMGFEIDNPQMADFVRAYIDQRRQGGAPMRPR
jgi:uncharacterized protein (TIGR01244 family)